MAVYSIVSYEVYLERPNESYMGSIFDYRQFCGN